MGKEQSLFSEQRQPYKPDAVILCTSPDGRKFSGMRETIFGVYGYDIEVSGFTPSDIPEEMYNGEIGKFPDAIAASKVLQVASRYPKIPNESSMDRHKKPILIANDVIFEVEKGDGSCGWMVVNKPPRDANIIEIKEKLQTLLSGKRPDSAYVEARFRCGAAAYDPQLNRGIMGIVEIPFWFREFSKEDIGEYIEKYKHDLHSTNGSCRWEDPEIFVPHLIMVNNVMQEDSNYKSTLDHFHDVVVGSLPGIESLIGQVSQFNSSRAEGDHTGCMNNVNNRFLHYPKSGVWGVWRTENLY